MDPSVQGFMIHGSVDSIFNVKRYLLLLKTEFISNQYLLALGTSAAPARRLVLAQNNVARDDPVDPDESARTAPEPTRTNDVSV